jgi:hypothetical protein
MFFDARYDQTTQLVVYTVTIPKGSYFSVGYGWDMHNVNMVWWSAGSSSNTVRDMWSTDNDDPKTLTPNAYTSTITTNANGTVTFVSTRQLDT